MKKPPELSGITDRAAIALYTECLKELEARGQNNIATREMLRNAAQWTEDANTLHAMVINMRKAADSEGKNEARIRGLMKSRAMAESEKRKILDDLLLTPQRPRGRPSKEAEEEDTDDGGWAAFDDGEGGDA